MLFMSGMCGILAVMTLVARSLPKNTRYILAAMELAAMFLLVFDRFAYIYRGDVSTLGYYMVRISNAVVFYISLIIPFFVTRFLENILKNDCKLERTPRQLFFSDVFFAAGIVMLTVSQFTGIYYTFDAQNNYTRSPLFALCYVFPFLIVIFQEWSIINNRKKINKKIVYSMMVCIAMPTVASVIQTFVYGVSLINMTIAVVVVVYFTYALNFMNEASDRARAHELEYYKKAQQKEAAIFEQTIEALANAIDAKDKYTRGHSTRVAVYSKRIAKEAGLSDKVCDKVYFAALLHDVGKIGVSNTILNKVGTLNDDEIKQIKTHPQLGDQILSTIKQAPFLSIGAHYHHERYDGTGYPDGLAGDEIPEIARIIAVADAYDAMTSVRSYRNPLEKDQVREELTRGMGTQFDPRFAAVMLRIMDS